MPIQIYGTDTLSPRYELRYRKAGLYGYFFMGYIKASTAQDNVEPQAVAI